ncbi:MAG TPA: hypothetical protein VMZ28_00315, partial [Kofleriaceae bacterium]|nr:hypothetical protein [Kofleriaceae bacterium]
MLRPPLVSAITYVRFLTCSAFLGLFLGGGSGCSIEEDDVGREQRAGGVGCISGDDDLDTICNDV